MIFVLVGLSPPELSSHFLLLLGASVGELDGSFAGGMYSCGGTSPLKTGCVVLMHVIMCRKSSRRAPGVSVKVISPAAKCVDCVCNTHIIDAIVCHDMLYLAKSP